MVGALLLPVAYSLALVSAVYQADCRERRFAGEIEEIGTAEFAYYGPRWIPSSVLDRVRIWYRIRKIDFTDRTRQATGNWKHVRDEDLARLKVLTNVEELNLRHRQITDSGLEHLAG
jgi:hypothetical protein